MTENKNLLPEFNQAISDLLDACTEETNPVVINLISTEKGRKKIVELIQKKVIRENSTIGDAINEIELEYSINSTE